MKVPIAAPVITEEDVAAVVGVLRSGVLANGEQAVALEEEFAAYCDVPHAAAVSSGTAALALAGAALGLGRGDEVLVAGFTFAASANAFLSLGCRVTAVDVDRDTMNISGGGLRAATARHGQAKVVVVVDLYGSTDGTDDAIAVARENGLLVIEDAAQAHGARDGAGQRVGGRADATTFSLYATKNMAAGEGGIVTTPSRDVADEIRRLRNHGSRETYHHEVVGLNHRITEMAAALARRQLARLDEANATRRERAALLATWCREAWGDGVALPTDSTAPCETHVFHQFTVRFATSALRDEIAHELRAKGVDARQFYPYTVADLPGVSVDAEGVPTAAALRDTVLSLPVHPGLDHDQLGHLHDALAATADLVR